MTTVFINPFNFYDIIVNYFFGTSELFIFGFIIATSFTAAYFSMSNKIFLTLLAIGSLIFAGYLGQEIYILIILIIGIITFGGTKKIIS